MRVILTRGYANEKETCGDLQVFDEKGKITFSAKTLELPWLMNQKGISCVPRGLYSVRWSFSPRLLHYTYELVNVPNRTGVRIHPGNFFFDIEGCILLGDSYGDINHDPYADILNSRVVTKKFEQFMNKQSFTLEIK